MYALLIPPGGLALNDCSPSGKPSTTVSAAAGTTDATSLGFHTVAEKARGAAANSGSEVPAATSAPAALGKGEAVPAGASPAQRRLNFLLQASVHLTTKCPSLSRVLQQQLWEVSRRHVLRLHASVKHSCCNSCFSLLLPQNASVRECLRGRGYREGSRITAGDASNSGDTTSGNSKASDDNNCCGSKGCTNAENIQKYEVRAAKRQSPEGSTFDAADPSTHCSSRKHCESGVCSSEKGDACGSDLSPRSCNVASCRNCIQRPKRRKQRRSGRRRVPAEKVSQQQQHQGRQRHNERTCIECLTNARNEENY
ncbi:rnase p protein subunit domain-containing protein [Cyclospora cayetanensis]|uniref:Rnase p protein subunit domain-containing protein n=1 Tax=Cyclospora cayetanensis TaxID=88456 RepID=A0A1D3D8H6_9EIME|nr:rnase p protein subunit domain-containing protein [Cyclospora cayetanensis]